MKEPLGRAVTLAGETVKKYVSVSNNKRLLTKLRRIGFPHQLG
jgi:hypothetical protein